MFSWVIAVTVTIIAVVMVVAAPVSTLPAMAIASTTAASVVVVFDPMLPPATAVQFIALALTLAFSFLLLCHNVQILSSLVVATIVKS